MSARSPHWSRRPSCSPNLAFILLLLISLLLSACQGYKPLMTPNVPDLLINEDDLLEFTCTSIDKINVFYPEDDDLKEIVTSKHEIIPESSLTGSEKVVFRREHTVFGDTGWYGCVDEKAGDVSPNYDDPNASWMYVYVRSKERPIVESGVITVPGMVGSDVLLPCRPTSPELHVDLKMNDNILELNENLTFNPKFGFLIKNGSTKKSGIYTCVVNSQNETQEEGENPVIIIVKFLQNVKMEDPVIPKESLQHVTNSSSLHVKCTIKIGIDNSFQFHWTTPRNSTTKKVLPPTTKSIGSHSLLATSEFVENVVTFDDEGEYICRVKSLTDIKSASVYIHIYDPDIKYINLTSHDKNRHYVINASKPVTFSAYVSGYPTPSILWVDPDGKSEPTSTKFVVEHRNSSTTLKIKQVELRDTGTYTLEAVNDAKMERLNFTLEVLDRPYTILDPGKFYYGLNETATFYAHVMSNPLANVSWYYYKCPSLPSTIDCEVIQIKDTDTSQQSSISIETSAKVVIQMSGKINCTACNNFGCDSVEMNILVSDGVPDSPFGIIQTDGKIVEGDNVSIVCAASIYNYTSVDWLNEDETPLISSNIHITYGGTNFTHRAVLHIDQVKKSNEGFYYCRARAAENETSDKTHYELAVNDPMAPHFTYVNMNGSEIVIEAAEAHNTIHLFCQATGLPKPIVTWYKNDEPLEINEHQFALVSNNQDLIIKYLMEKDSGKYSCIVNNRYGEVSQFQNFIVKGAEVSKLWIGIVVVLIIILIALLIYFCLKIKREKMMRKQLIEAGLTHFEEGALDCINPELTVDDQAELLPYDRKWEFPRDKLKLGKQLGSGAFGVVMKAEARGICADESLTTVAVKMVRRNAEPAYIRALASELKIMVHLGKHLNVVNLLGACTNNIAKRELLVIVEFCLYGNLHNYLLRHRDNFINQIDPETGKIDPSIGKEMMMRLASVGSNNRVKYAALSFSRSLSSASSAPGTETVIYCTDNQDLTGLPEGGSIGINSNDSQPGWRSNYRGDYKDRNLKPICTQDLLSWAFQVARGMEYLSQRKVLHGDLAARNILLAENNVVKICDFGLAKTMYKDDNYQKKGNDPVPIKWMAIESIRDHVFSTQSDVWSFGIVLWEFFTLAESPYPGMPAEKQYQRLIEGYRMEQPQYATDGIYDIMLQCWKAKPTLRPSFTDLVDSIGELLEEGVKTHYVELNSPYMDLNASSGSKDYLKIMLAPDHAALTTSQHDYVNTPTMSVVMSGNPSNDSKSPLDESGIFSPRPSSVEDSRFHFPSSPTSSSYANAVHSDGEDVPMLKSRLTPERDQDNYLKPIDVHKKREEFMRQREVEKRRERECSTGQRVGQAPGQPPGHPATGQNCSTGSCSSDRDSGYCNAKELQLLDANLGTAPDQTNKPALIISTQDNYVDMPKQKTELKRDGPDSFTNPSYIFVESNKSTQQIL